jgi:hypothetical protein
MGANGAASDRNPKGGAFCDDGVVARTLERRPFDFANGRPAREFHCEINEGTGEPRDREGPFSEPG